MIGPQYYGGEVSPSAAFHGASEPNGVKGGKGGNKKRRRSDDDSDDDDDEDGEDDGDGTLGSNLGQAPPPSTTASDLPNDLSVYGNGLPNAVNGQRFNQPQQPQSNLSSHPFFGNYPYPGYPHHMPNVNPALGNPLGFYAPSAAAMAAAAAATGQYSYGALPPHLLRAAAQQYAQETGSSNSTPTHVNNMPNTGYTPIVRSPTQMDMSQNQQQQSENAAAYGNRQNSGNVTSPRSSGRKPALHLSLSNNNAAAHPSGSQSHSQGGPSRNSSMHENDVNHQSQQQQQHSQNHQYNQHLGQQSLDDAAAAQEAAAVAAYAEQAGLNVPPLGGMNFPDSYLTSPSQLFPEIYRSMNAYAESQAHRAMTFGAENTPGIDEDDESGANAGGDQGRNVFRWPTMSMNMNNTGINNNGSANEVHGRAGNNDGGHSRMNGTSEAGMVKREGDNETGIIAELAMT